MTVDLTDADARTRDVDRIEPSIGPMRFQQVMSWVQEMNLSRRPDRHAVLANNEVKSKPILNSVHIVS